MNRSRIASFGVAFLLALSVPGVLLAAGGTLRAPSSVSIRYNEAAEAFRGRVDSPRRACERDRTVNVFKVRRGPDKKIGSDMINDRGRYSVAKENPNASKRFYAKVPRKVVQGYNRTIVCARDESRRIRI